MLKQIITKIACGFVLTGFVACYAEKAEEADRNFKAFSQFVRSQSLLVNSEFKGIPSLIKRITIVEKSKKNRSLPKRTRSLISDKIHDRIIAGKRFDIIECLECGSKKISIENNKLIVKDFLESNENFRKKGRELDIDAFLIWDGFIDGDKVILNTRMVQAMDNQVLWSKQYSGPYDPSDYSQFSLDIYIGALGYNMVRKATTQGQKDEKVDNLVKAGIRLRERFSALDRVEFSLGAEYFGSLTNRDKFNFNGYAAEARMIIDILPLSKNFKTNLYVAGGPVYYQKTITAFMKYGIEIPFERFGYISFGGQYLPKKDLTFDAAPNVSDTAEFGGTSYDLTLGIRL